MSDSEDPYQITATPEARRHLNRLPGKIRHAALALCDEAIAYDPTRIGKPLSGELEGLWSARRADYRVIYEIDHEVRQVTIHRVQHRADVYRPR